MNPTTEQQHAIDLYRTGQNLTISALAGAGKTTTLRLLANAAPHRRGLYVAFNKSVAAEARERFAGTAVHASTMHALAYPEFGRPLARRLNNSRPVFAKTKIQVLGLPPRYRFPSGSGATNTVLTAMQVLHLVEDTVKAFTHSAAEEITPDVVPVPASLGPLTNRGRRDLTSMVAHYAARYWADQTNIQGTLRPTHDTYLKQFQLTRPVLPYEYVMLDEAQDSDPVTIAILTGQTDHADHPAQLIAVGDENQAIYGWRGARNAMHAFGGQQAVLSQSWRFGDAIAAAANEWLDFLDTPLRVQGRPGAESSVWPSKRIPEAILCRTNGGALWEIVDSQLRGVPTAIAGERKTKELASLAQAAIDLQKTGKTRHPELDMFTSWDMAVAFADTDDGAELSPLVAVVDRVGAEKVLTALTTCVAPEQARTTVATGHIAKGLEFYATRVATDFTCPKDGRDGKPKPMRREEARLAYVAVTRAIRHADLSGLAWFADYKARGGRIAPEPTRA